jgi:hypothetical protein
MTSKLKLAPVAIFAYERLDHLKKTIVALSGNELASDTEIFIFSDGPKSYNIVEVAKVRQYLKSISGFKQVTIIERENNYGLSNNIIRGIDYIFQTYHKVIVLEDDLVTSKYFLRYMNDTLYFYNKFDQVSCISGYMYPVKGIKSDFFIKGSDCWGWATWKENWQNFIEDGRELLSQLEDKGLFRNSYNKAWDYDQMLLDQISGNNSSWAIRWYYSCTLKGHLCLYPKKSFVNNIGNDGSGTHSIDTDLFACQLVEEYTFSSIPVSECKYSKSKLQRHALKNKKLIVRIQRRLTNILQRINFYKNLKIPF